ncbi:MAG: hypothetical protein WCB68_15045, partial [Pyrinomonadaceae bacterium]
GLRSDVKRAFHQAHLARYGYAQEDNTVEIVSARLRSSGLVKKMKMERLKQKSSKEATAKPRDYAKIYFGEEQTRTSIYARDELKPGARLRSPCIVTEYSSTTLIPKGARAVLDEYGNLIIEATDIPSLRD